MRTVLLASLRTHTRRYGAALLAVVIGSAFIVVTAALSSSMREGLTAGLGQPYDGADAVVDSPSAADAARLLDAARTDGADAWLIGWTMQQVASGTAGETSVIDTDIGQLPDRPDRRWQELVEGRFPGGPGEAVVDSNTAKVERIGVGDRLRIGTGSDALDVAVVGLVDSPSTYAYASVYLLWPELVRWQDQLFVTSLAWAGPDAGTAIRAVVPDADVVAVDAFVQDLHQQVNNGVDIVQVVVLLFGAIALVVGILVINNTFTILFAQRMRDFALLRCVGATRRQVLRSVRLESLALGVLAAVLGVLAGLGAGHGLVALVRSQWPEARLGTAHVAPAWLAGAAGVAVVVTVVAAWLPTRRAVRVSPLAALRPDDSTRVRTRSGRIRLALGGLAVGVGVLALAAAVATANVGALAVGGTAVFVGVLLFGPVLVPALIRAAGPLTQRLLGPAGRLAAGNAVRNPRRTAATTASLLVGVTLTTAVLAGMASSRAALAADMDEQHPIDLAVTGTGPLPAETLDRLEAIDGVAAAVPVPGAVARIGDLDPLPLLPATVDGDAKVLYGDLPVPGPDQVLVPWDLVGDGLEVGDLVPVTVGDTTRELRVAGGEGWGEAALVRRTTLDRLAPGAPTQAVWLRAAEDADPEDLAGSVEAVAAPVDAGVENGLARRAYVDTQLDVLTGGVVGLLAIAVVIALVGIGNTLGLSVLERGREHALLRALGLTRRQVRRMLAAEAVLLSVVATVLGTVLGVAFAWTAVRALVQPAVHGAGLVLPWGQLALVVTISALAGLLAAVLPSRRAARITPAAGLSLD
ncbi:ABC transporter permease [Nocardioides daeguensis]|uniref:ABC transporter permease n=1 Tax=Nocardioides daeguensis TaxID=908359 RepID=A0ABP6UPH2_9ACTN|nr:FtsX-like permease family protein [Nocardioides daeguensis]MBV6728670.1 FtsX-like permease family protein [Nocardioides daeguensis]MCR1773721.1 FtsX-like permease family protein [Nocardioides daeguensis]